MGDWRPATGRWKPSAINSRQRGHRAGKGGHPPAGAWLVCR